MVIYNPKDWITLIFKFHRTDTFRRLFWVMVLIGIYAWVVAYVELEMLKMVDSSTTIMYQLLGFVISMLLVFRTNTAYERWWEGRKQWGSLVNASRNIAFKVLHFVPDSQEEKDLFLSRITHYAGVMKLHLRNKKSVELPQDAHQPNFIAKALYAQLSAWYRAKLISGEQLLSIDQELKKLTEICGACERIKKSPIPFSYSQFIHKFIFVYVIGMPFSFVLEYRYAVIPLVVFVVYVLGSLELIAEEIEDPFGEDANDLPMDELAETIRKSVAEIQEQR
jgi:putative membrane protein